MIKFQYILPFLALFVLSCEKEKALEPNTQEPNGDNSGFRYLHLSHMRKNSNPSMDAVVENTDYKKYDMLWLGGDLAHLTSLDDNTMKHIDSILDVGNENTLWALGNHDYSDLNRIEQFTNRPPYYATQKNGITLVTLDTQDSLSNIIGDQKDFLINVLDTIQKSSHLILLHHKLIWMYNNSHLEPQIPSVANGGLGDCFYCINPNNFNTDIYPKLVDVKNRGITVICIGGDIGFRTNEFEYVTPEGIYLLASGIKADTPGNQALLFSHDVTAKSLTWEFKSIDEL